MGETNNLTAWEAAMYDAYRDEADDADDGTLNVTNMAFGALRIG